MDVIKQQLARIQAQLGALTPSQKMLAASLVAIMILTLAFWSRFAGDSAMVPLLSKSLGDSETGQVARVIRGMGITPKIEGDKILVPEDRKDEIVAMLAFERAIPIESENDVDSLLTKTSPFDSADKTSKMWMSIRAQGMQRIISRMPGVKYANVLLDTTRERRVGANIMPTASVAVFMRDSKTKPDKQLVEGIAYLVAGGVAGMDVSGVKIIVDGRSFPIGNRGDGGVGGSDDIRDNVARYESNYEQKVRDALQNYGAGVIAVVTAKMNTETTQTDASRVDEIKTKEKEIMTKTSETTSNTGGGGQEPGTVSNTSANSPLAVSGGGNSSSTTTDEGTTSFVTLPSTTNTKTVKPAGDATPASATVSVPRSALIAQMKQMGTANPDEAAISAFIEKQIPMIRTKVVKALGIARDEDVFVEAYIDTPALGGEGGAGGPADAALATGGIAVTLTGYGKEIAVGVLAVLSLFMVSMIVRKSTPPPPPPPPIETGDPLRISTGENIIGEVGGGEALLDAMELGDEDIKSQHMVDQVQQMVKANPDAAAALVKKWLNR